MYTDSKSSFEILFQMAWRFKASKYKNAAPIVPKPENCVRDICIGSYQTYGNNITTSAKFMAFNWEHAGSSLAVLPLDDSGRKSKLMPLLHAHSDTVTDMDFSPFHDGLLATGSQDCSVKIWHIPEEGLLESLLNCECAFSHKQRRVETVGFHPTANYLLHSTSYTTITLWDLMSQQELFSNSDHGDVVQSISWKRDGTLIASSAKDKQVRIIDPRTKTPCISTANSHQSIKDSRIVWLGDTNRILTTGFDAQRLRQIIIRDARNFGEIEKSLELDCSTGVLMPLYDADTGMLFLAGKGDSTIAYMEVTDKEPYLIEGIRHSGEQTKGACLVPKRALNVMQGEVNRIMQLTSNSVIPITYQVPRKTYRDFHADLYPDTPGYSSKLYPEQWVNGSNAQLAKISLDPSKRENGENPIIVHKGALEKLKQDYLNEMNETKKAPAPKMSQEKEKEVMKNELNNSVKDAIKDFGKPRLGPKPFSAPKFAESEAFDKVFSVPAAPGSNGVHAESEAEPEPEVSPPQSMEAEDSTTPIENVVDDQVDLCKQAGAIELRKSPEAGDMESDETEKSLSISERRKMYERSQSNMDGNTVEKPDGSPVMMKRKDSFKNRKNGDVKEEPRKSMTKQLSYDPQAARKSEAAAPKRTSTVFGRVSKFRHLKGTPAHKSFHIENVRNLSRQISGECDGFHANSARVAVPLSGPGGKIAIFELSKTGRLPDGVIPTLVQGSNIMDFQWDPFDKQRLAVACDDGIIKLWIVPESGLSEPTNTPEQEFNAHSDKIYFIKFHPTAKDVLASGSFDMTIRLWDLTTLTEKIVLKGHTDQMFSFAWSPCGNFCSTMCKDGKIRLYKPRSSDVPIREGKGPVGNRGARLVWALDGNFIVVMGFDKVSERQIMVFKSSDLNSPLNTIGLDVSPAILIPFYDEDSSTLFLTGKGDTTIYAFEVTEESPYICPLSHHRCNTLHQGLSFLPKNVCDVQTVEFAKALRLTNNAIEPLSFTVPRIKTDLFQDDLFPPTSVTWTPTLSSSEWFAGKDKPVPRISLKPEGMENLSDCQGQPTVERTINKSASQPFIGGSHSNKFGINADIYGSAKSKQNEISKSVSNRMEVNMKLEQDEMEGVDEKEWDD